MKEKLLVIGNGMSALRTIEELLNHTNDKYEISIFGEEPHVNYNRIMLSYLLSREKTFGDTILNTQEWYDTNEVTLYTDDKISQINRDKKVILNSNNEEFAYDKLLIATGSVPFIPTTFGSDLNNVLGFRTKEDVDKILNTISNEKKAVVVGGGLLGLEAAYGIAKHGIKTLLIHRSANIMSQQLDTTAGKLLQKKLETLGIEFRLNTTVDKIHGEDNV
ncbi:MAG: NAD(P)/FAD-dependent oxidoreductase, partial [Campylobacteraceae bacterium]|nr:NAD(P)/FAD-dependent oxidoreductase [Campylobacteraceae bacterium]